MVAAAFRGLLVLLAGIAPFVPAGRASVQATPTNDDLSSATILAAVPFANTADTIPSSRAAPSPSAPGRSGTGAGSCG